MKIANVWKLIISLAVTFVAGLIGSLATFQAIPTWYANLNKTVISPPNWVFGPVWTLLYILMAVAAYLVWKQGKKEKLIKEGLTLFVIQLALNSLWSILFFGSHLMLTACAEIIFLLAAIIMTTAWFFRVSRPAGYLMIPYIVWVSFASFLNLLIWLANR